VTERLDRALAAIDAANADDPATVSVRGSTMPLAQAHGVLAAEWVVRLHPDADDTWVIAARAHHLRRWEVPRTDYPEGRAGYHRWKRDQKQRHARDAADLLSTAGYDSATIERVQALIRRDQLAVDAGSQAVEDAACLAFLETQLADVATKLDRTHLVDVLRKTATKMTPAALEAAGTIDLGPSERALLREALGG
jgi:hypothetical protein